MGAVGETGGAGRVVAEQVLALWLLAGVAVTAFAAAAEARRRPAVEPSAPSAAAAEAEEEMDEAVGV